MKKNNSYAIPAWPVKLFKALMMLKCIVLLVLISTLQCFSKGYSQNKITIHADNTSLKDVLKEIERTTYYRFVYNDDVLKEYKTGVLKMDNAKLNETMNALLENTSLTWKINKDNLIVISLGNAEQALIISGKVTGSDGEPLPGVSVRLKGSANGTSTDTEGKYQISVADGKGVLVFSYVGFKTQEVGIENRTSISIVMQEDVAALTEVVVNVGYGTQKRPNILGAVNQVKNEEIEDFPVANLTSALRNSTTTPGLSVGITSGKPGANTSLNIRQTVTLSANGNTNPLFVIDGIQSAMEDFENLDATMVESISILKDAAASIYGARGANGVVLVTTKKGKPGKARISYSLSGGINGATKIPEMLDGYDQALLLNSINSSRNRAAAEIYTDEELAYVKNHNYDWLGSIWEPSGLQRHTVNISGGSDKVTYFVGANYYKENGNLGDLDINKYGLRFGMNAQIIEGLNASVSLSTDNSYENNPRSKSVTSQTETMSETFSALLVMPRWTPMYINGLPVYDVNTKWHPYEMQNSNSYAKNKSQGVALSASLEYKVPQIKGLSFRVNYGRNVRNSSGKEYYPSYNTYEFLRQGNHTNSYSSNVIFTNEIYKTQLIKNGNFISESYNNAASYQLNELVTYDKTIGEHSFSILAGAEQSESNGESFSAKREGQVIPGFDQIWGFTLDKNQWDNNGSSSEGGRMSYLSRLNYSFKNRYLLEGTFRADASPNFPKEGRWGYFPSVALGWRISEENFFKDHVSFVNELKIRAQIGLTGNDNTANYQYKERYTQSSSGGIMFGDVLSSGLDDGVAPNPHITWEKAFYKNLGFDGSFAEKKWDFSVDLYHRRSYDMLETPTSVLPSTYANTVSDQNHGEVKSWGMEYRISYNGTIGRDFKYTITPGIGGSWMSDNKVIRKYVEQGKVGTWQDPNGKRTSNGIEGYRYVKMIRTQEELDDWMQQYPNYKLGGSAVQLGNLVYEDINGDGTITDLDIVRLINRTSNRFSAGCNFQPSYRGFRLQWGISASFGGYQVFEKDARTAPSYIRTGLTFWQNSWSAANPDAEYPAIDDPMAKEQSSYWIRKNKCIVSLGNLQASYALPQALAARFRLQQLRIFATLTNLWDFGDPLDYKYSDSNKAFDYPAMRTLAFGLNVNL